MFAYISSCLYAQIHAGAFRERSLRQVSGSWSYRVARWLWVTNVGAENEAAVVRESSKHSLTA